MPAASAGPPKPTCWTAPASTPKASGRLDRPRSTILLAERGDQLVACAHVADVDGKGYFGMFSVDPAQQGGGVGKQLMDAAEAHAAREWNVPVMQMTVIDVRDELIAFYERRGYSRTGIKKPFPYGDERFGIPKPTTCASRSLIDRNLELLRATRCRGIQPRPVRRPVHA